MIFTTERPGAGSGADVQQMVVRTIMNVMIGGCRAAGGAQPGLVMRPSTSFEPPGAKTLGQTGNFLTVCENRISVAGGAVLRTIRRRGGHLRTTGGVVAGAGIRRWGGTDRHGAAEAGWPGGGQASAILLVILASNRCLSIGRR